MNTKKLGDIGVARAINRFAQLGWTVSIPITDSQDYDLVVEFPEHGLCKIQAKYSSQLSPSGSYAVQIGIRGGTKGSVWKHGDTVIFDYLFIATSDGNDWLVPRSLVRSSIKVGMNNKNSRFLFT